ncbi:MAG: hypothetical protein MR697_02480, partial [Clostridiales bacterium]|nr:hypothetical protein [Clostridiales bacterium]
MNIFNIFLPNYAAPQALLFLVRQPRTIASARFAGSFPPILRFEKLEILRSRWRRRSLTDAACPLRVHTVFLRFS